MKKPTTKLSGAFSLVELLVVIAVIAIIAAIAIPNLRTITGAAEEGRALSDARNIIGAYEAARAAGLTDDNAVDRDEFIAAVTTDPGATAEDIGFTPLQPFADVVYYVPVQDVDAASRYIGENFELIEPED